MRLHSLPVAWQDIQWGTVPTWISGLLSSASLFLALWIIKRDRAKAEREQISQLVVIVERRSVKRDGLTHHITLINSSKQIIYDLSSAAHSIDTREKSRKGYAPTSEQWFRYRRYLHHLKWSARRGGVDSIPVMQGGNGVHILKPDEEATIEVNTWLYKDNSRLLIRCKDAGGRYWLIDPVTKATVRACS